jgi:hypothetical protein
MHVLRLAYSTQFVVSLVAFFLLWGEVGGAAHLDLMPWYLKLGLGVAAAYSFVRATAAAVSGEQAWNGGTVRWAGILLSILVASGLATYYYHVYAEDTADDEDAVTQVQPCRRDYCRPAAAVTRIEMRCGLFQRRSASGRAGTFTAST